MFGFGKDKSIIEVKFYEGESNTPFVVSNMPIEQLPDTFEIDTSLNMNNVDWVITEAQPAEKAKFKKSGKLDIYVVKKEVVTVDPNELLYSLPTINDEIPSVENAASLENVIVFAEDDWRQFEFIARANEHLINEEFEHIVEIYNNHRDNIGFKQIHVRQKITKPLENNVLSLALLESYFDIEKKYTGVAFNNVAATVQNGFALQTRSGWVLWGQSDNSGIILSLNLRQDEGAGVNAVAANIDKFIEEHKLYLIDWPGLFWCGQEKASFSEYN